MSRIIPVLSADERLALVAAARSFRGTRFRHIGRGVHGLDCLGLVVVSFGAIGYQMADKTAYSKEPTGEQIREAAVAHFGPPIPTDEALPGDIALMRWHQRPQHVAILGDYPFGGLTVIHSDSSFGEVTEHRLASPWDRRIVAVHRP
jgi:cell wall-associated NlpC family hydrolase